MPGINKKVTYRGRVGYIVKQTHPGAQRVGGRLVASGAMTVTILFADGRPPTEVVVPECDWAAITLDE
jgi:hypothetical protein